MADTRMRRFTPRELRPARRSASLGAVAARSRSSLAIALLLATLAASTASAATFIVNNNLNFADQTPGDGNCFTGNTLPPFFVQECTLRAAIMESNALAGYDTIEFSSRLPVDSLGAILFVPGTGGLPAITDGVLIDGYTAPTYDTGDPWAAPVVTLDGTFAGGSANGLTLLPGADGTVIRGIGIVDFSLDGIKIGQFSPPESVNAVRIQGCHIGIFRGWQASGNGDEGIAMPVGTNSINVVIGQDCNGTTGCSGRGNVISANGGNGITLNGASGDVGGNRIGTDGAGSAAAGFGNGGTGVRLQYGVSTSIGLFVIVDPGGANTPDTAGNLISGNALGGVSIEADGASINANLIGTNAAGTASLPNVGPGLSLVSDGNYVGGEGFAADAGNLISGNTGEGIKVGSSISQTSSGNQIRGNRIGVSADGASPLGNGLDGISVSEGSDDNFITGNLVSGNFGDGIDLNGRDNSVARNWLGTNASNASLGNAQAGIRIRGAYGAVGGLAEGNVVGFNIFGMVIESSAIWSDIQGNSVGVFEGADIGNIADGILVYGATNTIGGDTANPSTAGNVIGYNGDDGIEFSGLSGGNNWVEGNWIGVEAMGQPAGNGGHGVRVGNTNFIVVGSTWTSPGVIVTSRGNDIAHNSGDAVRVTGTGFANAVRGNRMWQNGGLGVDLEPVGPTPNDPDDSDFGPNYLQNYPIVDPANTYYDSSTGQFHARFKVDGDPINTTLPIAVDFYIADASGQEGLEWLGAGEVPPGGLGVYQTVSVVPPSGGFPPLADVVATATTSNNTGTSSEFSPPIQVPEPAGEALLAAGLAALALLHRHRATAAFRSHPTKE